MLFLLRTISARRIAEHPLRSLLTLLGIALGVASFISVQMILTTITDSFASMIDAVAGRAQLQITGGESGVDDSIYDAFQKKDEEGRLPVLGVQAAVPTIQVITRYKEESLLILAVDTLNDSSVRDYRMVDDSDVEITDPLEFLNATDSILLNREFAARHGLALEDRIEVLTSQGGKSLKVRGFLEAVGAASSFGGNFALMDIVAAQILFGRQTKFDTIDLVLAPGADLEQVREDIDRFLQNRYKVARPSQRNEGVDAMLRNIRLGMMVMSFVVLAMGGFIIFNTLATTVYQRMREIGMLRMLGVGRMGIGTLFLVEASLFGMVGSAAGIAGGYLLGRFTILGYLQKVSSTFIPVHSMYAAFDPSMAIQGALVGLAVSLVGGLYPSLLAMRVAPVEVVRFRPGLSDGKTVTVLKWLIASLALALFMAFGLATDFADDLQGVRILMIAVILLGITVTPLAMAVFLRFLVRATGRTQKPLARMASENVLRDLGRASMTVAALMVAMSVMFELYLFMNSTKVEIKEFMNEVLNADLMVTSSTNFAAKANFPVSDEVSEKFRSIAGVRDVVELRLLYADYEKSNILILSLNYTTHLNYARFRFEDGYDRQAVTDFSRDRGVFLSKNLIAQHPSLKGAGSIELMTPGGRKSLPVLGTLVDYTSERGTVLINRGLFVDTFEDRLVDTFQLYLDPGADLMETKREIDKTLGQQFNLFVLTNREFKGAILDAIDQLFVLAVSLEILTLLIALIGIVNNIMANVLDHTREIGVLRSIGATKRQVARIYLTQSGILGFCGAFIAGIIGFALGRIHLTKLSEMTTGWEMPLHYSPWLILIIFVSAVILSVLAGAYPASHAARMSLRDSLKYE